MEIVSKFDCLLSNAEVMTIIRENQDKLEAGRANGRPEEVWRVGFDKWLLEEM